MNRLTASLAATCLVLPSLASAGEIHGTVTRDSGPVPEGTPVAAECKGGRHGPAQTDKSGRYRLVIAETGKCTLTVTLDGQAASVSVVSFDDAAQVDLVVQADAAGKLTLRRK